MRKARNIFLAEWADESGRRVRKSFPIPTIPQTIELLKQGHKPSDRVVFPSFPPKEKRGPNCSPRNRWAVIYGEYLLAVQLDFAQYACEVYENKMRDEVYAIKIRRLNWPKQPILVWTPGQAGYEKRHPQAEQVA